MAVGTVAGRGVLLTARALELENVDRDLSRESVMEAVKLAPTLVPLAVLASKYESEAHQVRRSMRIVETPKGREAISITLAG